MTSVISRCSSWTFLWSTDHDHERQLNEVLWFCDRFQLALPTPSAPPDKELDLAGEFVHTCKGRFVQKKCRDISYSFWGFHNNIKGIISYHTNKYWLFWSTHNIFYLVSVRVEEGEGLSAKPDPLAQLGTEPVHQSHHLGGVMMQNCDDGCDGYEIYQHQHLGVVKMTLGVLWMVMMKIVTMMMMFTKISLPVPSSWQPGRSFPSCEPAKCAQWGCCSKILTFVILLLLQAHLLWVLQDA